jgi:hypothetical protein
MSIYKWLEDTTGDSSPSEGVEKCIHYELFYSKEFLKEYIHYIKDIRFYGNSIAIERVYIHKNLIWSKYFYKYYSSQIETLDPLLEIITNNNQEKINNIKQISQSSTNLARKIILKLIKEKQKEMENQKVLSIEKIKELVQEKGYYKFKRQCKEENDNSVQEYYNLTSDEVTDIFKDSRLKGIRRSRKRVIVFAEDIETKENDSFNEEVEVEEIAEEQIEDISNDISESEEVEEVEEVKEEILEEDEEEIILAFNE